VRWRALAIVGLATTSLSQVSPAAATTIRADSDGVKALGSFRVAKNPSLRAAIRAFGEPTRITGGGNSCRVGWHRRGLVLRFANFGGEDACEPRFGRAQSGVARGPEATEWRTDHGLKVGQRDDQIPRRHPSARRINARSWWLVTGLSPFGDCPAAGCPYAVVEAWVRRGRVSGFRMWIGAAGE
jgi:hypothetical protein